MTYGEESWLLDSINSIAIEVHENNMMLRDICGVANMYLANHHKENEDDFGRNVLANLISNMVELSGISRKR